MEPFVGPEAFINIVAPVSAQWRDIFASLGVIVLHGTHQDLDRLQLWLADYAEIVVARHHRNEEKPGG